MSADSVVSRLDGVRRAGEGRWMARWPAHNDKSPSLSIREMDDGRVLAHCFGGCAVEEILSAVGRAVQLADAVVVESRVVPPTRARVEH